MAKKSKLPILHSNIRSKRRELIQANRLKANVDGKSLMTKGGYVSVRVVLNTESKVGTSAMPKLVLANESDPRSVSIFIAGGSEVDQKVALANAKLISDIE